MRARRQIGSQPEEELALDQRVKQVAPLEFGRRRCGEPGIGAAVDRLGRTQPALHLWRRCGDLPAKGSPAERLRDVLVHPVTFGGVARDQIRSEIADLAALAARVGKHRGEGGQAVGAH